MMPFSTLQTCMHDDCLLPVVGVIISTAAFLRRDALQCKYVEVQGSAEAVRESVMGLADSEVGVKVVWEGVGPVTTTDIDTAQATGACILAFNVKYANAAVEGVAKVQAVQVVEHRIIYRMLEQVSIPFCMPCLLLATYYHAILCCHVWHHGPQNPGLSCYIY